MAKKPQGKRYNKGKTRYALMPDKPLKYIAEVYTRGAHKYSVYEDDEGNKILGKDIPLEEAYKYKIIEDGANNWRKGLPWMEAYDSVERHLRAYKVGEDFDPELATYHLANAGWGILALLEFYETHPELDDRLHRYLEPKKVGLDIDGVLADFVGHLTSVTGHDGHVPQHWNDPIVREQFDIVKGDPQFWLDIPPLMKGSDVPWEVHCYITARSIDPEVTKAWLDKHHFPHAKIYCVGNGESKVDVARKAGMDLFVDDSYDNFVELNRNGICTFLYDAPYNQRYPVGYKRIKTLKELPV